MVAMEKKKEKRLQGSVELRLRLKPAKAKLMLKRIASKECLPLLGVAARELYNSLRSAPSHLPDACSCGDM